MDGVPADPGLPAGIGPPGGFDAGDVGGTAGELEVIAAAWLPDAAGLAAAGVPGAGGVPGPCGPGAVPAACLAPADGVDAGGTTGADLSGVDAWETVLGWGCDGPPVRPKYTSTATRTTSAAPTDNGTSAFLGMRVFIVLHRFRVRSRSSP
jgi:hypothetical protein